MQEIALHTRLRAGAEEDYERIHAVIPDELDIALREAGVQSWRIWRDGQDVFHIVACDDYHRMRDFLRENPVNIRWQEHLAPLFEVADDYSGDDSGLALVWQLPEESARSSRSRSTGSV